MPRLGTCGAIWSSCTGLEAILDPQFKYAGEAIFLVGIAFRLLRWAYGAIQEGDAPPSASDLTLSGNAPPAGAVSALSALMGGDPGVNVKTSLFSKKFNIVMPPGGSPELPPEVAAQLTPELRAKVVEAMAKIQPGTSPVQFTTQTSLTTHLNTTSGINPDLFPPEMLAAMTPEQRAKVMETLTKQVNGGR